MKQQSLWLLALLLLATTLRLGGLGAQELSGDEAFSVLFSLRRPAEIASETLRIGDPHPPLYNIALHGWMAIAGDSEYSARFPSAVAGILAVALAFALTRRMFGWNAGLAAATFMAINPFQIWYAQTSRMYAAFIALTLLGTIVLWTALRSDKWWPWVGYSLLTATLLYLHYYALLVALAQGIWVLVTEHRRWRQLMRFIAAATGTALLYLPWLVSALPTVGSYLGHVDSLALHSILVQSLGGFSLGEMTQPSTAMPFLVAFGLLLALGLWYAARIRRRETVLLALWLLVPLVGTWIASLQSSEFTVRYVIAASPPFYILLGLGSVKLAQRRDWRMFAAGLLVMLCLVGTVLSLKGYYVDLDYPRTRGWRDVASYLDAHAAEGDLLVQNYPDPALIYYVRYRVPIAVVPEQRGVPAEEIEQTINDLANQYSRIWFLPYPDPAWDPTGVVRRWLERHAELSEEAELGDMRLQAYVPLRLSLERMSPVDAQLGSNIRLLGYRLEGEAQPGSTLKLTLYWEASGPVDTDYTVFTHLLDATDTVLGQMDHPPQNGAAPTSTWRTGERLADSYEIPIRPDAPTGPARLVTGMYDPATNARLPATGPVDEFDRINLTEVEISPTP